MTDKIIYFSFHYLRYILVLTQLVVICVFFYRFQVDQQIVDLKDGLTQKEEIVNATQSLLKEIQQLSVKVDNVQGILHKQNNFNELYAYFFSQLPANLTLTTIRITTTDIQCDGLADDANTVKQFYDTLKNDKRFQTVELPSIRKSSTGYNFTLSLKNYVSSK